MVGKRFYPILQIEANESCDLFSFTEKKGRWTSFKLPQFVSTEMIAAVKAEVSKGDMFN